MLRAHCSIFWVAKRKIPGSTELTWFATQLLQWFDQHGRKDLPWQHDINAYRVWVSEIMLQQTQVTTVIPYFNDFVAHFPNVGALAAADLDTVLHHWTGLGYYARARNLHKTAREVASEHGGEFPVGVAALSQLPGIGRSTAGAIAAIAQGQRATILDGNAKRVLARFHAVAGFPGEARVAKVLWSHAQALTPRERIADYTQAIMDLGASVCSRTTPLCTQCPLRPRCSANNSDSIAQFPGKKPKKAKPVRSARHFLIHDDAGGCLLERRPTNGIWGGLWTPPERAADVSAETFGNHIGLPTEQIVHTHVGAVFRHTFSHFHLDIEPVYIKVQAQPPLVQIREDVRWYVPDGNEPLGLSAPAVKLLRTLEDLDRS